MHVEDVVKKTGDGYRCTVCESQLIVVKSEARKRDWHFRHQEDAICAGTRNDFLHEFAKQVVADNTSIMIAQSKRIGYSNPRMEAAFQSYWSDVLIDSEDKDVHVEIVVTHDLGTEKTRAYEKSNTKCVRIDLTEPALLTADKQAIIDAVLNQWDNKTLIGWQQVAPRELSFWEKAALAAVITVLVAFAFALLEWFFNLLFRPRYSRR